MATQHNFRIKNGLEVGGVLIVNSSGQLQAASISGAITSTGNINLTSTATTSPAITFNTSSGTDTTVDMAIRATGEGLDFYEPEDGDKVHMRIVDDAGVNAVFGFRTGTGDGTLRLDGSGNLTNIGTVSSGAITSTGNIGMSTGHSSGKFAVMATSVHNSYDFYNNGTSYFNGTVTVDANLTLSGGGQILGSPDITAGAITSTGNLSLDGAFVIDTDTGNQPLCINRLNSTSTTDNQSLRIHVDDASAVFESEQDETGRYGGYIFKSKNSTNVRNRYQIENTTGDSIWYNDAGTAKMLWDASEERLGINTTTPATTLDVNGVITSTVINTGDATLLTLHHDTGADIAQQKSFIDFSFEDDNTNETPQVRIGAEVGQNANADSQIKEGSGAFVVYTNNADTISGAAGTSLAERMRVDYQGNVLIGKTASDFATAGAELAKDGTPGKVQFARASNPLSLNNITDNGNIVSFYKGASAVGDIGIEGGDSLYIQSGTTTGSGLRFHPSAGTVEPVRNGVTIHNTINLGSAARQFKDAYFQKVYVRQNTTQTGAVLEFSDEPSSWSQNGSITFRHVDTQSYGSGAMFEIGSDQATTTILAQGKLYFSEGLYTKPASGTGVGTLRISSAGNATLGTITSNGNLTIKGDSGFNATGETASIYLGDTASEIRATYDGGTKFFLNGTDRMEIEGGSGNLNLKTGVLEINGTPVIDASRNHFGAQATFSGKVVMGGDGAIAQIANSIAADTSNTYTLAVGSQGSNKSILAARDINTSGGGYQINGATVIDASRNITAGTITSSGVMDLTNTAVSGAVMGANRSLGINAAEAQIHLVADNSGDWASNIVLTNGGASPRHYWIHNAPATASANAGKFELRTSTTTDANYIGGQGTGSSAILTVDTNGATTVMGNISINNSDGFVYLNNDGVGNAGIYVRGIGSSDTLRSHSTDNFRWEVLGSQKMELNSSGQLDVLDSYKLNGGKFVTTKEYNGTGYFASSGDWHTLCTITESNTPAYFTLKLAAHSTITFVVTMGYHGSNVANINVLSSTWTANGGYPHPNSLRILKDSSSNYKLQMQMTYTSLAGFYMYARVWGAGGPESVPTLAGSLGADTTTGTTITSGYVGRTGATNLGGQWVKAGSNAAPSYSFHDDDNTGMYRDTTDSIGFTSGGTQRVTISNGGLDVKSGTLRMNGQEVISATRNLSGAVITGTSLNVTGLVRFGDTAGSPAADIHVYGTGNNYLRLRGTAANDYEIDLEGTGAVGNLVFNQFDIKTGNNIIIDGSSKYLIIENHAETDTGIIFNDGDASTGGNWDGSSSQAFKIQYHCGNETLIMGHDDDSYAGFNFGKGGALTCSGNITAYSDERLKENIQTLDGSKVLQMRGVSFTKEGKEGSGVIAQELEKIAPELVNDGEYKSVAYGNLVGYLIELAKEQQKEIDELKQLINNIINSKEK